VRLAASYLAYSSYSALAKVNAPVGFEIGSQTVPEIAVSIVAELIQRRNMPTAK
jgi:xanthine dehydrogenase accessory factor